MLTRFPDHTMQRSPWTFASDRFLNPTRIWALAIILVLCLWTACIVDFTTPGLFDRAGNIKFQDFLQFTISARLTRDGRADQLYDDQILAREIRATIGRDTQVFLQYFYGPQVPALFVPLSSFPFLIQAEIWVTLSLAIYFACVYLIWKRCPSLQRYRVLVTICALAYPPLFHFCVRGQLSVLILIGVTAAYLAFAEQRDFLAGVALGFLVFKPQFLVGIFFVLLLARAWKTFAGLALSAGLQLALTAVYFRRSVMLAYLTRLVYSAGHPGSTELPFSAIQMHSVYSFWEVLIPWIPGVWVLYLLTAAAVIAVAARTWSSPSALNLRFSSLLFAAVLVNPHIYIYDLLALAPIFITLADWLLQNPQHLLQRRLGVLLYLGFLLPLFGPLAHWTHLQFSVAVFAAVLWTLWQIQSSLRPAA
ncbi:MAG TPA: glycosyltransferase family 87 protein [Candidatus Binatia bacterium]|nr:glycosyltransferase family 87 protein [Candidatus Binatia bacterium]